MRERAARDRVRGYDPGPFSEAEDAVQHFVSFVARCYLDGHFRPRLRPRAPARIVVADGRLGYCD